MKIMIEALHVTSNINSLNKNFYVTQKALDTKEFGTPTEMLMSLMLDISISK